MSILLQLAESAANANAFDFIQKIEQAAYTLQAGIERKSIAGGKVNGGLVEIYDLENLVIVSDLHGDSKSLFRILSEIDYEQFLSNPMNKLVFLGDYIDRGSDSISIMYSVCYLKSTYPDSVILMRGNHEAAAEFPFSPHDFPYEIEDRFGNRWRDIYKKLLSMFTQLTLATLVRHKLLLVHGGLPTEDAAPANFRKSIAFAQKNHVKSRVFEELLWNDPVQIDEIRGQERSRRGFGRYFGPTMTRRWLQASGAKAIVRGHEPCHGFKLDHNNMILTLFSCMEAYPNFKAAYLRLSAVNLDTFKDAKDLSFYVKFLA
jgi:predicted phosphodiesterase